MSDELHDPPPGTPDPPPGLNVPLSVRELLADVESLKAWRTDMEARIDQLGGNA